MPWPSGFPPWQQATLESLSSSGQLSGINPLIIAGVEQAETGGWSGGAINSSGYGGYFGESTADGPTAAQLQTGGAGNTASPATQASYTVQAIDAARIFANLMQKYGGNVGAAETAYQQGSYHGSYSGGAGIVASVLGTSLPGNPNPGPLAASGGSGVQGSGAAGSAAGSAVKLEGFAGVLQQINDLLNPATPGFGSEVTSLGTAGVGAIIATIAVRGVFSMVFLGLTYIGIKQMTSGGGGSSGPSISDVMDQINQNAKNDLAQQRVDVNRAAVEARAQPKVYERRGGFKNTSEVHHYGHKAPKAAEGEAASAGAKTAATAAATPVAADIAEGAIAVL
jgi:hypothetical protein